MHAVLSLNLASYSLPVHGPPGAVFTPVLMYMKSFAGLWSFLLWSVTRRQNQATVTKVFDQHYHANNKVSSPRSENERQVSSFCGGWINSIYLREVEYKGHVSG